MRLFRYIAKEVYLHLIAITCLLLLIFITHQFLRYLDLAASGKLPFLSVLELMSIQIPLLLGFLLPLGLYLSLLLAYGRLYIDHEMVVMGSSGVSPSRLLLWTSLIAVVVAIVVAILMFLVEPKMKFYQNHIMEQAKQASPVSKLMPGKFQIFNAGRYVVYANQVATDKSKMRQVFVANVPANKSDQLNVLVAKQAYQWKDPKNHQDYLVFQRGYRYQGRPGDNQFQMLKYGLYGVALQHKVSTENVYKDVDGLPTNILWVMSKTHKKMAAELHWRFAMPIAVMLLAWLAVPMSRISPRQGRYAKLIPAILVFIVYADGLFIGRAWITSGDVSNAVGLWWLHGLLFALFVVLSIDWMTRC